MNVKLDADPLDVTTDEFLLLARALFEEQERMLPEGERWEDFSENDKSYWTNSVKAVVAELRRLRGTPSD